MDKNIFSTFRQFLTFKRSFPAFIILPAAVLLIILGGQVFDVQALGPINVLPYIGSYEVTCGWHGACKDTPTVGKGVDFGMDKRNGLVIYATAAGTVHSMVNNSSSNEGWGNQVVIRTPDGSGGCYYHRYAHLLGGNGVFVRVGQSVGQGTPLAYGNNSGASSGPHLHYHVYQTSSCSTSPGYLTDAVSVFFATDTEAIKGYNSNGTLLANYYKSDFPAAGASSGVKKYSNYSFPTTKVTDDGDTRYSSTGTWNTAKLGLDPIHMDNRDMRWVYNVSSNPTASASWQGGITSPGMYEIYAFIPYYYATTAQARYQVSYYDPGSGQIRYTDVRRNQGVYSNQWVSLGWFCGNGSNYPRVTLFNDTGESSNTKWVGADAMMWVKVMDSCAALAMQPAEEPAILSIQEDDSRSATQEDMFSPFRPEAPAGWKQYSGRYQTKDIHAAYSFHIPPGWYFYPIPEGNAHIQNFPMGEDVMGGPQNTIKMDISFSVCKTTADNCSLPKGQAVIAGRQVWTQQSYDELFDVNIRSLALPLGNYTTLWITIYSDLELDKDSEQIIASILNSLHLEKLK